MHIVLDSTPGPQRGADMGICEVNDFLASMSIMKKGSSEFILVAVIGGTSLVEAGTTVLAYISMDHLEVERTSSTGN